MSRSLTTNDDRHAWPPTLRSPRSFPMSLRPFHPSSLQLCARGRKPVLLDCTCVERPQVRTDAKGGCTQVAVHCAPRTLSVQLVSRGQQQQLVSYTLSKIWTKVRTRDVKSTEGRSLRPPQRILSRHEVSCGLSRHSYRLFPQIVDCLSTTTHLAASPGAQSHPKPSMPQSDNANGTGYSFELLQEMREWFQKRRQMILDDHSLKIASIRYHYYLLRVQARRCAAGELLDRILKANLQNEAEEVGDCEIIFLAEFNQLQRSESSSSHLNRFHI